MAISAEAGPRLAASVLARAPGRPVTDRALGRDRLTVLGYHRIVDPEALGDLHPGVVSATPAMFARQMDRVARELTTTAAATTTTRRCRCRGRGAFPPCSSWSPAIGTDRVMRWDEVTRLVLPSPRTPADLPLGRRDLDGRPARLALARELLGRLKELPDDRCAEAVVAERTWRPAVAFADPNGGYDAASARIAGEEGISLAFTMDPGPARMPDALRAPPAIPRIGLDARDTFDAFRLEVPGGLAAARGALAALRPRGRR